MENKSLDEDAETSALRGCTDDDVFSGVEVGGFDDDDDDDQFERVCAICDNGGNLLCCEGECMRSFHATEEENCESLGFTEEQVQAISTFYCKNCQYKRHQCFACGKLGSSDKTSTAAQVFCCVSGECGRFYHPSCVSKLLHRDNEAGSELLKKNIASGASFTCPLHKCCVCNLGEIEEDEELRFASCRRCPKSYHRKCLPKEIAFEDSEDNDIIQRAWEDLMPKKRILIYCLEHEIDDDIGTPIRNHVRFPAQTLDSLSRRAPGSPNDSGRIVNGRDKTSSSARPNSIKGRSLRDTSCNLIETPSNVKAILNERKKFHTVKPSMEETNNILPLDVESKKRILALMKDASSSITLEMINKKYKPPSTHVYSSKDIIDKTITLGKVEGSVEALRTALRKLEEGCSIEDAKAVCGPGLLSQMMKWKNKLKIYLAPALHGMRYTSYGRHFTNSEKLNKIVDMLHWYARDGDMIVDFGCGANEFSCLMKKKLDEVGKKCSYKNYDILYPKNDFKFEQRNWLTVHPKELPPGSKLIMGLNPPFGVNSNLANQFINKALEFKPKLIVLIVPPETERLDAKNPRYDLIFQNNDLLTGKSFYLPGSVDVNNKQIEQWNRIPPPLYFWSRQDWTTNHKSIAQQQGHLREVSHMISSDNEFPIADFPLKDNEQNGETSTLLDNHLKTREKKRLQQKEAASKTEKYKEELLCANRWSARHKNHENKIGLNKLSGEVNRRESGKKLADDKTKTQPHFWTEEVENREEKEANMAENNHREELLCANSSSGLEILDSCILKKSRISPGKRRRDLSEIYLANRKKSRLGTHFQTEEAKQLQKKAASFAENQTLDLACANCSLEGHKILENGILTKIHNRNGNWRRELGEISSEDKNKSGRSICESQPAEMSLDKDVGNESYGRIDGKFSGPHQSGEGYGGNGEDDMARKYHTSYQDPVQKSKNLQEPVSGLQIEVVDNNRYGSHIADSPSQKGSYAASHDPRSSPCESVADSSRNRMCSSTSTSMKHQHTPHPDEVNHTRVNNSTSEQPSVSKNKLDILGFAPGPNRFAHNSSAGWLDE